MKRPLDPPAAFWVWALWRDRGAKPPRPLGLPGRIPASWWARYALHVANRPKPYQGILAGRGALMREPSAAGATLDEQAGKISWAALNVGDYSLYAWSNYIGAAYNRGIRPVLWRRCRTRADVAALTGMAGKFGSYWLDGILLNIEDEIMGDLSPAWLGEQLHSYRGEAAIVALGWVQNGQGWKALKDRLVFLEVFANERPELTAAVCEAHAQTT